MKKSLANRTLSACLALCLAMTFGLVAFPTNAQAAGKASTWTLVGTQTVMEDENPDTLDYRGATEKQSYTDNSYTVSTVDMYRYTNTNTGQTGEELQYSCTDTLGWNMPQSITMGEESSVEIKGQLARTDVQIGDEKEYLRYGDTSHISFSMKLYCYEDVDSARSASSTVKKSIMEQLEPSLMRSSNLLANDREGVTDFANLYSIDSLVTYYDFEGVNDPDLKGDSRPYVGPKKASTSYRAIFSPSKSGFKEWTDRIARGETVGRSYDNGKTRYLLVIEVEAAGYFHKAYVYSCDSADGQAVTTNTTASKDAGEDKEGGIPIPAIVIGLIALVGGGVAIGKARGGKDDGKTPPDDDGGKDQGQSSFRMVVWKDFGDTLHVGEAPQKVGARIEETRADGTVVDRPDLTARISISGSETISVGTAAMDGRYMAAPAQAVEREGQAAYDGTISFVFTGEGGTLTNNVTFHIVNERGIVFADEALTFIAGKKQTLAMPFGIKGIDLSAGADLSFKAQVATANAPFADVLIKQDEDYPQLFDVELTETGIPEGRKDSLPAGYMENFTCVVTATVTTASGKQELAGEFEFYRFHEGIRLSIQHLRAYYTVEASEYNITDANGFAVKASMNALSAASGMGYIGLGGEATAQVVGLGMGLDENKAELAVLPADPKNPKVNLGRASATISFYTWDEETGRVLNPMPKVDLDPKPGIPTKQDCVTFTFEDIPGSCNLKDKDGNDVSKPCETLKFFAFPTKVHTQPNTVVFSIIPTKGLLTPPNRTQAKVTVSLTYKGQVFTAEETVNVLSQPYRADADLRLAEYQERDEHILDRLQYIQKKILLTETTYERSLDGQTLVARNTYDGMMPVYHRIETMLEGYDPAFGYYEPDYERIESLFNAYTTGALGTTAAADCAFYGRAIENSEALMMTMSDFNHSWTLIGVRIGFAVFTKGTSEGLFMAIQAEMSGVEAALKAADKGDDALEIFRVGCSEAGKTALIDYSLGKIIEGGLGVAGACAKGLCSTAMKAKSALAQKLAKGFSTAGHGAKVEAAAKSLGGELDDSARAAQELIERFGNSLEASKEMTERDIAYCLGRINGKIKVGNFAEALKDWKSLTRFQQRNLAFAIQRDKHAMRSFMEMKGEAAEALRAQFNAVVGECESKALKLTRVAIAGEKGVPLKNVRIKQTSGNKAAEVIKGKKINMDMDATFEIFENGKWVDVPESYGQKLFDKEVYKIVHGFEAASDDVATQFAKSADLSIVDAAGLESYGTYQDALRVIQRSRAGEIFDDATRVGATAEYKCEHWLNLAQKAMKDANAERLAGNIKSAEALAEAAESFAEEGARQFSKQYDRIVVNKLGVLKLFGINPEMATLKKAAEIIRKIGIEKSSGITSAQADVVLEKGLGTDLKTVFHWLNEATVELDKTLQQVKK